MAPASAGAIFCFLKLDALRRLGDGSQQLHQLALVHPAAVVGKGVEAACTQNESRMPRFKSAAKVGSASSKRWRSPFSMLLAKMPCRLPEKRMFTARWFCMKAWNSSRVSVSA